MTQGAKTRLILYVLIAMVPVLMNDIGMITQDIADGMYWTEWLITFLSPSLAGMIAWRAFIDQSISDDKKPPTP